MHAEAQQTENLIYIKKKKTKRIETDLSGHFCVRPSITVLQLYVGLLMDAVQVLVESVQKKCQQLLRVLLLEAVKSRCVFCYCPLDRKIQKELSTDYTETINSSHSYPDLTTSYYTDIINTLLNQVFY